MGCQWRPSIVQVTRSPCLLNEGESIHRPAPNEDDCGVTSESTFSDKFDRRRVQRRTFSSSAFTAAAALSFGFIRRMNSMEPLPLPVPYQTSGIPFMLSASAPIASEDFLVPSLIRPSPPNGRQKTPERANQKKEMCRLNLLVPVPEMCCRCGLRAPSHFLISSSISAVRCWR